MTRTFSIKLTLAFALGAVALTACGDGDENDFTAPPTGVVTPVDPPPPPPPPPPPAGTPQQQAGAGFATAFNQGKTDEPVDPVMGDIIPLDKTGEPIAIPDP